jgi:biotin synthase
MTQPPATLTVSELESRLRESDPAALSALWAEADRVRRETVGNAVHLRGLIELSNYCVRSCLYCGIRAPNPKVTRYRMNAEEVLDAARAAVGFGYGTVVLQGGEDYGLSAAWVGELVRRIKNESDLAVTLSLGERPDEELAAWRNAGADRYLLRFETSDDELYRLIHPPLPGRESDRLALLQRLQGMGYEAGGGVMIGIPGQSYATLARDIALFSELDLDMIGVGPFIAHPDTPLGNGQGPPPAEPGRQVPNTELMALKVVALARLVRPDANIPATTALATIGGDAGRASGLRRGANVVMPNLTPERYRNLYEIYPDKAGFGWTPQQTHERLTAGLATLGRPISLGPGGRRTG